MKNKRSIPVATNVEDQLASLLAQVTSLESQVNLLVKDNENLAKDNALLATDLVTLKQATDEKIDAITKDRDTQVAHWKNECDKLVEQIKLANMRYFGSKSEKVIPGQLSLFNEMEVNQDPSIEEPALEKTLDPRPRKRGGKRTLDLTKLETVYVDHVLSDKERTCSVCATPMDEFKIEVTRVVKMVPAHLVVEEHRRQVYICKPCSKKNALDGSVSSQFKKADIPALPIKKSFASPSLIAYILYGKYSNALPLYRMEEDFKCLGIKISRQNMANWVMSVHEQWLSCIHARMKEKLLSGDIIHCDESEVQVLKEPNREAKQKSRMWLFCSPQVATPNFIYEYHETRSGQVIADFFKGWCGTITTDGYDPYFNLCPRITNTACLVHVRRKFAEIVKVAGGDTKAESVASVALQARRMLDEMFSIDKCFDNMTPENRKVARMEYLLPKMEAFEGWTRNQINLAVPKMALHKALAYTLKYWPYVKNVLADGRLELSNNLAERAIKPFVIGRKNYLFSDTPRGAHASAAIYSITTTAKMNGLNPRLYFEWLLETMPNIANLDDKGVLDRFLPWSSDVPDACKLSPKAAVKAAEMADEPVLDIDLESLDSKN